MADKLNQPNLFEGEYQEEIQQWLCRRLQVLCLLMMILAIIVPVTFFIIDPPDDFAGSVLIAFVTTVLWLLILWFYGFAKTRQATERRHLLRNASIMIFLLGLVETLAFLAFHSATPLLLTLFIMYVLACVFLPWTPAESVKPFILLLLLWAGLAIVIRQDITLTDRILLVIFTPIMFIPGLVICAWRLYRHRRQFSTRMVDRSFMAMQREFRRAQDIHESMFPQPYDDQYLNFQYCFVPMADLGGDFVHFTATDEGRIHLTVLDVTSHGLAAALTVNRMYGELERIRGAAPRAEPGEVIAMLNQYVHLTLSRYNVYATAICVTIDPSQGRLFWASGGHNPALLHGRNGSLRQLDSTALMLGAQPADEFDAVQKTAELRPNDMLLLYTDGAAEARDRKGEKFGLQRLRELLQRTPAPRNWPQFIASRVQKHQSGRVEDDVLVATVTIKALPPDTDKGGAARLDGND